MPELGSKKKEKKKKHRKPESEVEDDYSKKKKDPNYIKRALAEELDDLTTVKYDGEEGEDFGETIKVELDEDEGIFPIMPYTFLPS